MKTLIFLCSVLVCCFVESAAQESLRLQNFNLDEGVALQGYDPVSYTDGKAQEGKKQFTHKYFGITYYFVNNDNRLRFIRMPEKYEPAYGGWCAYAMGESGEKVKVDPETFKIINGRTYLFYNFWGNNTLKDWNKNEQRLKSSADNQWKKYSKQ